MKILYVTNHKDISIGGDSHIAWELARSFSENTDNEVWILKAGDNFGFGRDYMSRNLMTYSFPSTPILTYYNTFNTTLTNIRKLFKFLNELKPDLIHVHLFTPISFFVQSWALKEKVPFVYTSHLLPSSSSEFHGVDSLIQIFKLIKIPFEMYTKSFYQGCTSIITINESSKTDFKRFIKKNIRYDMIPNGIYLNDLPIKSEQNPAHSNIIRLIFVGHISRRKNQHFLVKSLLHLKTSKTVELYIIGTPIEQKYFDEIQATVKNVKKHKVFLPGFIDHNELLNEYSKSTFLVSSSKMEVQSLIVIEGLACGLPVIGLENETISELVKNDVNGYVVKKEASPQEFAKIIDKACSFDGVKYNKMSKEAQKSVEFLRWENIVKRTESLYIDLIKTYKARHKSKTGLERIIEIFIPENDYEDDFNIETNQHNIPKKRKSDFLLIAALSGLVLFVISIIKIIAGVKKSTKRIKEFSNNKK